MGTFRSMLCLRHCRTLCIIFNGYQLTLAMSTDPALHRSVTTIPVRSRSRVTLLANFTAISLAETQNGKISIFNCFLPSRHSSVSRASASKQRHNRSWLQALQMSTRSLKQGYQKIFSCFDTNTMFVISGNQ